MDGFRVASLGMTVQEAFTYSFPDNSFFNSWKGASSEKKSGLNVFLGEKGLL